MRKTRSLLFSLLFSGLFFTGTPVHTQEQPDAQPGFSWNTPQATVLPDGNLEWAPHPFVFGHGPSLRYIDYENGDDSLDGGTRATAWKHHPWDRNASGRAKAGAGLHTYVFKGGVVYRGGTLTAGESGTADTPIRLTRDPAWGEGRPVFYGSKAITGGWQRVDVQNPQGEAPGITLRWSGSCTAPAHRPCGTR